MKPVNFQRTFFFVALILFLGVLIGIGTGLYRAWVEYEAMETRQSSLREDLDKAQEQRSERDRYLRLLLEDPEFRERVARERLGYSKPGEIIFRFEEN